MSHQQTDDEFTILMIGTASFGAILAGGAALVRYGWHSALGWMLEHHVLAPASANPILALPFSAGAGLDGARVCVLLGALVLLGYGLFRAIRRFLLIQAARRIQRRQEMG